MKYELKIILAFLSVLVTYFFGYALYLCFDWLKYPDTVTETSEVNKNGNINNNISMDEIRRPAVAGSFYPANKNDLSAKITDFLNKTSVRLADYDDKRLKIILVPHAGFDFSGQTAAYGYKILENYSRNNPVSTVIMLASSHNYQISGAAADGSDSWETPEGKVNLDKDLMNRLGLRVDSKLFVPEHSLEVQLPFLQKALPNDFQILPILVGDMSSEDKNLLASTIANNINDKTLIVVSSDMSHYPAYDDANKYDREIVDSILTGDVKKLDDKINQLEQKNIPNIVTFMCGKPAVELGMILAKKIGADDVQLLNYANSGDTTGDKSRVVGYSVIGFFENAPNGGTQRAVLLQIAHDSVESFVKNGTIPNFEKYTKFSQKSGAFVTLTLDGQLRGCIGLMESDQPLYKTVSQMAVAAAAQDNRFNPVTVDELPTLKYEISILSPMKKISNSKKIQLGKHGVKVTNNGKSGVFLPQVALETGWGLEEFMGNLCESKAGLPRNCWKDPKTEVYVFSAEVFSD